MNYFLAIDTTSPELGLCASNFGQDFRIKTWNLGRELSTHMHQYLADFIQPQTWSDFGAIAVAKGPGGFTGTRIGVVTARTLAQQLDIPLLGISTLAAVAWSEGGHSLSASLTHTKQNPQLWTTEGNPSDSHNTAESMKAIAVQMPAQRGQLFVAVYGTSDRGVQPLLDDTVMSLPQWQETITHWQNLDRLIQIPPSSGTLIASMIELAYLDWQHGIQPDWSETLPFYGQHPVSRSL